MMTCKPGSTARNIISFLALLGTVASSAEAQQAGGGAPVITHRDMVALAGATAGAAALSLFDVRIAHSFGDTTFHNRNPGFTSAAKRASIVTETVLMLTGGAVYAVARIKKQDATADVALHTTESIASAAMFIQVVRGVVGRARPYVVDDRGDAHDSDPYEFDALHGFTSFNYRSFPSMHAMASFAAASALSQEMKVRGTPNRRYISPALYVGAAMPALARLYLDEHWASDIALGVFLGVLSGSKVVAYSHAHPTNWVDRRFLGHRVSASVSLGSGGVSFGMTPY